MFEFEDVTNNFDWITHPTFIPIPKQEFKRNLGELWEHGREHGFWSTLQNLIESLDPLGEKNALKVRWWLGVRGTEVRGYEVVGYEVELTRWRLRGYEVTNKVPRVRRRY